MNKTFHQLAPLIALEHMDKSFQDWYFQDGYTVDHLKHDSDIPDLEDHSNLESDDITKHSHSYKLEEKVDSKGVKKLHWVDGDAIERLKSLCQDAHDFHLENIDTMTRYSLSKATHFICDVRVYMHLHVGKPSSLYHAKYEDYIGDFLVKHKDELIKMDLNPEKYNDIYKDTKKISEALWHEGVRIVDQFENGKGISDEDFMGVCISCVQGIMDTWETMRLIMKI